MKKGFKAVVESGSYSPDGKRFEEREDCGHLHKTIEAAEKCLAKKQTSYCNHGRKAGAPCRQCNGYAQSHSTSALWYNGRVHNQDGERA